MDSFAQNFEQDEMGRWRWVTERPLMRDARSRFDLSVYGCWQEEGKDDDSSFEIVVDDPSGERESIWAYHEAAWNYIVSNCDMVESVLRRELLGHHRLGWEGFQQDVSDDTEGWDEIRELVDWESESAIDELYGLVAITLGPDGRDDCSIARFQFASSWDSEHGADVTLWRDRVVN